MHEHHQVEKLVRELLAQNPDHRIKSVRLVMGELLGFDETSVRLYFENFTEGTPAEGAELRVRWIQGELQCPRCRNNFVKIKSALECPSCGKQGVPTEIGKEFFLEDVVAV
jgi:hydrogenase nickel incorporation protein HypA/HybF